MSQSSGGRVHWSVYVFASVAIVMWASTPISTRIAVVEVSPWTIALSRPALAGLVALPLLLWRRWPLPKGRTQWTLFGITGLCGFVGFPVFFSLGLELTTASRAGLVLAAMPVTTGLFAAIAARTAPSKLWALGSLIALIGEVWLLAPGGDAAAGSLTGDLFVAAAGVVGSLGYVGGARLAQGGYDSWSSTFWGATLFGIAMFIPLAFIADPVQLSSASFPAWSNIVLLALGPTLLAYVCWYRALAEGGIARVSILQFLQTPVTLAMAAFFLSEPLSWGLGARAGLILVGVAIARRG